MLEEITLDRGFEVKTFKTIEEKNIFDYRDRLIRLGVGLRYNMDKVSSYLKIEDENELISGLILFILNVTDGKLHLLIKYNDGAYTGEIVFMNPDGTYYGYNQIDIPVGVKVQDIISDKHFKGEDLHIVSQPNESLKSVVNDIIGQILRKYS